MEDTDGASCQIQIPRMLTSLHVEILSRILMLVEGSDIPAVVLTLYSVIMTRQFWYHRLHRLCKEHLITPPEEELEAYTISELAHWTFRRLRSRCTRLSTVLRLRSYKTEASFTSKHMKLVPGGRWLLVVHRDLRVCYFDLDRSELEQQFLFDPKSIDPNTRDCSVLEHHMWIDHKAPRLSFRYAICILNCTDKADGLQFSRVQIYQVNLVGHGASATPVAQVVATFRTPERDPVLIYTFNDRYFVQVRASSGDVEMELYDYSRVLGCLDYPLIQCYTFSLGGHLKVCPGLDHGFRVTDVEVYGKDMEFINEDVFVVRCWLPQLLQIFNVESPTSVVLQHTIDAYPGWIACSQTCWTPESSLITRIDLPTRDNDHKIITIHGLVIPHNRSTNPWSVKLGEFRQGYYSSLRLGIFISITCDPIDNISRIRHEWDWMSRGGNLTHVSYLEHDVDEPRRLIAFDEDTGRSIHRGHDNMVVVDLVVRTGTV